MRRSSCSTGGRKRRQHSFGRSRNPCGTHSSRTKVRSMDPVSSQELESLRREMRAVTSDIINKVQDRTEIASRIGALKRKMNLDVKDERAAQDIRDHVIS